MVCLDHFSVSGLVSAEAVVRKLVHVEKTVRRNPKQLHIDGLDLHTKLVVDETDGVTTVGFSTPGFSTWVANRQREEAPQMLKQGRLFQEERVAQAKKNKKADDA